VAILTESQARKIEAPTGKPNRIVWDSDGEGKGSAVPGFGLRVSRAGNKSFILDYRISGRKRRYTIGRFDDGTWTVKAARERAGKLRQQVDNGIDPLAAERAARGAPTLRDLWARFEAEHLTKRRESTRKAYRSLWKAYGGKLAARKVAELESHEIESQHARIAAKTPYRANRWLAMLSKMFSLAVRWKWRSDNPCKGIERAPEYRRERYLSGEEITRLLEALKAYAERGPWQEQSANAIRLLILTGARRMEVLAAKWEHFDLESGVWSKPPASTKQKEPHRVPLSGPAVALLSGIERSSEYVFPGRGTDGHQSDIKNAWAIVTKLAGIENARLHDLRHTYAAHLASAGQSLPIIGALLGHTQAQTTQRYAHLLDDPLRQATERVAGMIDDSKEPAKVRRLWG
jgi:integrase